MRSRRVVDGDNSTIATLRKRADSPSLAGSLRRSVPPPHRADSPSNISGGFAENDLFQSSVVSALGYGSSIADEDAFSFRPLDERVFETRHQQYVHSAAHAARTTTADGVFMEESVFSVDDATNFLPVESVYEGLDYSSGGEDYRHFNFSPAQQQQQQHRHHLHSSSSFSAHHHANPYFGTTGTTIKTEKESKPWRKRWHAKPRLTPIEHRNYVLKSYRHSHSKKRPAHYSAGGPGATNNADINIQAKTQESNANWLLLLPHDMELPAMEWHVGSSSAEQPIAAVSNKLYGREGAPRTGPGSSMY